MRYRIVTDSGRGRVILDDIDMLIRHVRARGWHFDGIYENKATRPELQGHPLVRELSVRPGGRRVIASCTRRRSVYGDGSVPRRRKAGDIEDVLIDRFRNGVLVPAAIAAGTATRVARIDCAGRSIVANRLPASALRPRPTQASR